MRLPGTRGWTPRERKAAGALAAAWIAGTLAGWVDLDRALARATESVLHPARPSVAELSARVGPGDPRPAWYAAALRLRAEMDLAESAPQRIDPNAAGRAEWDRLPGIGPVTAIAIVEQRRDHGPFRGPADLLDVRGIGPRTLAKLEPFLDWGTDPARRPASYPNLSSTGKMPDLNLVNAAFLSALPGFGPKLAERILRERQARGTFRDWEELLSVEGIGPGRLRVLQSATRLTVSGAPGGIDHQGQEWNR